MKSTAFHRFVKIDSEYVRVDLPAPTILNMDKTHEQDWSFPTVTIDSEYSSKELTRVYSYSMAQATNYDDLIIEENVLDNYNVMLTIYKLI